MTSFPAYTHPATAPLYRIHRQSREPWWFASDGAGRFDLPPPDGTCYLAAAPLGCLVEVVREVALVAQEFIAARRVSTLRLPETLALADCTARRARRFGITGAIHSTPDYALTQAWAAAFHGAGFRGVRYFVSHDPAQRLVGIALFGTAGPAKLPAARTTRIPHALIDSAARHFGIRVLPGPGSGLTSG